MKNLLLLIGIVTLIAGAYFTYQYMYSQDPGSNLTIAVIVFVISLACWGYFFFLRFKEEGEQDISITKFN